MRSQKEKLPTTNTFSTRYTITIAKPPLTFYFRYPTYSYGTEYTYLTIDPPFGRGTAT